MKSTGMDVDEALQVIQKELDESESQDYSAREALDVLGREVTGGRGAQFRDITLGDLTDMTSELSKEQLGGVDPSVADFVAIKLIWDTDQAAKLGQEGLAEGSPKLFWDPGKGPITSGSMGRAGQLDVASRDDPLERRVERLEDAVQRLVDLFEQFQSDSTDRFDRQLDAIERRSR